MFTLQVIFSVCFYLCQGDEVPLSQWKSIKVQSLEVGRDSQTLSQGLAQLKCHVLRSNGWDLLPEGRFIVLSICNWWLYD